MSDEQALLIAIPLRHLESLSALGEGSVLLPAGGPGDLNDASAGMPVLVMATDAGEAEVPAATWRATYVERPAYEPGSAWPPGLPPSWLEEHAPEPEGGGRPAAYDGAGDLDDGDEDDDWSDWGGEDDLGPQAFLRVADLAPLPRESWVFANELVRKQARRGRSFRPRVPTLVDLPG